jgi:hypothetical protein
VNEGWIADRQIGWRSTDGLRNTGTVRFEPVGPERTEVMVTVNYEPPGGALGNVGEILGAGGQFQRRLQHDLSHFAEMVAQAPPGALDPTSSSYLFHADSAAARGTTTRAQEESMGMTDEAASTNVRADDGSGLTESTVSASDVEGGVPNRDEIVLDPGVPPVPGTSRRGSTPSR